MDKRKIDKIAAQALNEIQFSRTYKQGKIGNWQQNEEMYYNKMAKSPDSRANISLARMQEFIHVMLSKIDNPLTFNFAKRKESQTARVEMLNTLKDKDNQEDNWNIKDIVAKKQALLYGRAIYSYYADSINGYKSHLENVDVYDFLVDPAGGGIDLEKGCYMGRYDIIKNRKQLKKGVKDGLYNRDAVKILLDGSGDADNQSQEDINKQSRSYDQDTIGRKEEGGKGKYKFWEWYTTYNGTRYYLLMNNNGLVVRAEKLKEIFETNMWPFWSWAVYPDLTEFWTPSPADYAREIFMAQEVSINQMFDNAESINKPQKAVDSTAIKNMNQLRYRKNGIIELNGGDVNKAIQILRTPSIDTPMKVYDILENIQAKASGATPGAAGAADEDGKVGIYEGNQQAIAERFGLLNKSYSFGTTKFAKLWEAGVREHLKKKVAIDIVGPEAIEVKEVNRNDLFKSNDDYSVVIESSDASRGLALQENKNKVMLLNNYVQTGIINPKKAFEMEAKIVGFNNEEVKSLLDVSEYSNSKVLSEAERDIERILEKEDVELNINANAAYKQRFVNYMSDHKEDMSEEEFQRMSDYIVRLEDVIIANETRAMNEELKHQPIAPQSGAPQAQEELITPPNENQVQSPTRV